MFMCIRKSVYATYDLVGQDVLHTLHRGPEYRRVSLSRTRSQVAVHTITELRSDLNLKVYSLPGTQLPTMVVKRKDEFSKAMRRCYEKHVTHHAVSTLLFIRQREFHFGNSF